MARQDTHIRGGLVVVSPHLHDAEDARGPFGPARAIAAWLSAGRVMFNVALGALTNWAGDRCASMSAALAFYAAFSLAPMLVVIIAVASFSFGYEAVQGRLYGEIADLAGEQGAVAVQAMMASAWKSDRAGLTGLLSAFMIMLGASATFAELNGALDRIWRTHPPDRPFATLIRVRLRSFGLVVGTGFLLVVLLVADTTVTVATDYLIADAVAGNLARGLQHAISFAVLCFAFAILLKVLPDVRVQWRDAAVGAVAAGALFGTGKHLFALYLAHAGTANAFGAASSLAVLMMWLYFSSAVFLLGAELSAQIARERARPAHAAREPAAPVKDRAAESMSENGLPWLLR